MKTFRWAVAAVLLSHLSSAAWAAIPVLGSVVDAEGRPVAGATVELRAELPLRESARLDLAGASQEPLVAVRSDAAGRYRVEAPSAGLYRLRIGRAGSVPLESAPLSLVEEEELRPATLREDAGGVVVVRDASGEPVAGARVRVSPVARGRFRAVWFEEWISAPHEGATDGEGRFRFARGAEEKSDVSVRAESSPLGVSEGESAERVAVTLESGRARGVEVREGASPAAGVLLLDASSGRALAVTDAEGRATVYAADARSMPLVAIGAGGARARATLDAVAPGSEAPGPMRVALTPGHVLEGTVIESEGRRAVPGALVRLDGDDTWWGLADARGGYRLEIPTASAGTVFARAAGYLPSDRFSGILLPGASRGPTVVLAPASGVEGRVVDAAGAPVADASIEAKLLPARPGRRFRARGEISTRSDERGLFRLRRLDPEAALDLHATKSGYGPAEVTLHGLPPLGVRRGVTLELPPPGRLVGRVLGPDEGPVAGARIALRSNDGRRRMGWFVAGEDRSKRQEAMTDANGGFALTDLGVGRFDLDVTAAGFAPATIPGIELPEGGAVVDLGEILLDPGVEIEGIVIDRAGKPLEGAELGVGPSTGFAFVARMMERESGEASAARSGPDGRFRIPDRRAGERVDVSASLDGYGTETAPGVVVPPESPIRIVLDRHGSVRGRVVDDAGRGVADASVSAQVSVVSKSGSGGMQAFRDAGSVTTDERGAFELARVPPGSVSLQASSIDGAFAEKRDLELAPGASLAGIELRLTSRGRIVGRVVDPLGRPAAGAMVDLLEEDVMSRSTMSSAMTDGEGRFTLLGVPEGTRKVSASLDPYRPARREVEVGDGEVWVELALEPGLAVRGRVVGPEDEPVPEARVLLMGAAARSGPGMPPATDGEGRFEVTGLAPDSYRLRVMAEGYAQSELPDPIVVEGADVEGVLVRLERGGAIFGRIEGASFDELAEMEVSARGGRGYQRSSPDYRASYRLEGLADGDWLVTARIGSTGRQASGNATLAPGAREVELDLEFGEGLVLSGSVIRGDEPVGGVRVLVTGVTQVARADAVSSYGGTFRFEGLAEGSYRLQATDPIGGGSSEETIELDRDREILVRLSTARISGRVTSTADGAPLAGATVHVEATGAGGAAPWMRSRTSIRTGDDGSYRVQGLAPGSYRVVAQAERHAAAQRPVEVFGSDDAVDSVDFALEPNEGIELRGVLWTGVPPRELWVASLDGAGHALWTTALPTDEEGAARFTSLPPGEHDLLVASPESATARARVTSPGGLVEVSLPQPGSVRVSLPKALGPEARVEVRAFAADGSRYAWIFPGLVFDEYPIAALGGRVALPAGEWRLEATAPDGARLAARVTVVAGGEVAAALE